MNDVFRRFATWIGQDELYEKHGHHIPRIGKVLIVGGIGFIIQSTVFEILGIDWRVVSPSTATLIGAECAILSNFFLNERFNFRSMRHRSSLPIRIVKHHVISSSSVLIQWSSLLVAEQYFTNAMVLRLTFFAAVAVGFIFNYMGYYFFVWREKDQ